MALIIEDRIMESSTTTGTGALTLAGAYVGYKAFSSVCTSPSDTCYYFIEAIDGNGVASGEWESGMGTYSAANTLTRTTVSRSSNANAAVSFVAGTKRVSISASRIAALLEYTSHRLLANSLSAGNLVGGTMNINSTVYTTTNAISLTVDLDVMPFTHYRVRGYGNATESGQTVTGQLATYGSPTTGIHTGGNDIVYAFTATTQDSGWITRNDGATGITEYAFVWKGSNGTVDLVYTQLDIFLKVA